MTGVITLQVCLSVRWWQSDTTQVTIKDKEEKFKRWQKSESTSDHAEYAIAKRAAENAVSQNY